MRVCVCVCVYVKYTKMFKKHSEHLYGASRLNNYHPFTIFASLYIYIHMHFTYTHIFFCSNIVDIITSQHMSS